jgi:endonuclease/exonuclease/phosphatase family metal-dependent hydrolase
VRILLIALIAAWATPAAADTLNRAPNHLYLCTFNVYRMGGVDPRYLAIDNWDTEVDDAIPERIHNLANVIATGGFHLVVLQEVHAGARGYHALRDLTRALYQDHGMRYRFFLSDPIGRGLIPEAIGFLYRRHAARLVPIDGARSTLIEVDGRDFVRTQWIAREFDFTLVSAHLAWGNAAHRIAGYRMVEQILTSPANFSTDPDVIVLGDFNRFGGSQEAVRELDRGDWLAPNVSFFDPDYHALKNVTVASVRDKGVANDDPQLVSTTVGKNRRVYDIVFLSSDVAEEFPPGRSPPAFGVDFGIIHFDHPGGFGHIPGVEELDAYAVRTAYSDHRPLWIRFATNGPHSDGTW